jgi:uncharacterized protein YjbI with pentapeptide repeats
LKRLRKAGSYVGEARVPLWATAFVALAAAVVALATSNPEGDVECPQKVLAERKLCEEADTLRRERTTPFLLRATFLAGVTALVGLGGLLLTLRAQQREFARQSENDRTQRAAEAEQAQTERFFGLAAGLASERPAERASALIGLRWFETSGSKPAAPAADSEQGSAQPDYGERVFSLLCLVLPTLPERRDVTDKPGQERGSGSSPSTWLAQYMGGPAHRSDRAIGRTFVRLLSERLAAGGGLPNLEDARLWDVDLSDLDMTELEAKGFNIAGALLDGTKLVRADLTNATLAKVRGNRRTDLSGALLNSAELLAAQLSRSRLEQTRLQGANLESATLRGAKCRGARFDNARLHNARLDRRIDLTGASFKGAELDKETRFEGARFDDGALKSLLTTNWRSAHFDADTKARLERLASYTQERAQAGEAGAEPSDPAPKKTNGP